MYQGRDTGLKSCLEAEVSSGRWSCHSTSVQNVVAYHISVYVYVKVRGPAESSAFWGAVSALSNASARHS
jgi:hypothetical protein